MKNITNRPGLENARMIGALFLFAFLAYGFGRYYFENGHAYLKFAGAILVIINSIIVLLIGVLIRRALKEYSVVVGNVYLAARTVEAVALSTLVFTLMPAVHLPNDLGYFIGMVVLGLGSIAMCLVLHKYKFVPAWLVIWGAFGYAVFAFGFIMELFGKPWSMYLLAPGGLWELAFAVWLIIEGGKSRFPAELAPA